MSETQDPQDEIQVNDAPVEVTAEVQIEQEPEVSHSETPEPGPEPTPEVIEPEVVPTPIGIPIATACQQALDLTYTVVGRFESNASEIIGCARDVMQTRIPSPIVKNQLKYSTHLRFFRMVILAIHQEVGIYE
jgi:hypothetical protein